MPMRRLVLFILLPLAACAATVTGSPLGDRYAARRALTALADEGSVPLVTLGISVDPQIAADAVPALDVAFKPVTTGTGGSRVVLWKGAPIDGTADAACAPGAEEPGPPDRLLGVFCEGGLAVAQASVDLGTDEPDDATRRVIAYLFPDDYPETHGLELFGIKLRLGGTVGF